MKLLYSKIARTISSYPGTVLAVSLFLILLCSVGLYRITIDTSVDGVFPDDHPLVLAGSLKMISILVVSRLVFPRTVISRLEFPGVSSSTTT